MSLEEAGSQAATPFLVAPRVTPPLDPAFL